MPADNLAAALAAGGGEGVNPFLLQFTPELQLAQQMEQAGLSTGPASPAQALARLAQAGLGAYMQRGITSDLANVIGSASADSADLFPPGSVPYQMAHSPNPMIRAQYFANLPKFTMLASQYQKTTPGEKVGLPGALTQIENTNPRSPVAIAAQDAQRAAAGGNQPAAQAIESGITKETSHEAGPQYPPTNVMPRGTQGIGATPVVAVPPPETKPTAQNMPEAIAQAKATQEGATAAMKDFTDEKTLKNYNAAQNLLGRLDLIDHNINQLGAQWMGAGANAKAGFAKVWNSTLDTAGLKGMHFDPTKVANWEDFTKETTRAGMELINQNFGGSREAASIIQMGRTAVPNVENSYLGAKYVSATIRAAAQREIDLYNYKANLAKNSKSLVSADADFNAAHPAQGYAMRAITSQIPPQAIAHLKTNPALASRFDEQFGPGTAEFLLGPQR